MEGFHPIHRRLLLHWLWQIRPFSGGQAWIDLILLANHKDSKASLRGQLFEVKRGEVFRSKLELGSRWGWSRGKVDRFLKVLENDGMVAQRAGQHATFITLLNYDRLHKAAFKNRTTDGTSNGHQADTKRGTYNNGNNGKNEKNKTRSDSFFDEGQKAVLKKEIAQSLNHGVDSEANQLQMQALIERVSKARGVRDCFGYAIQSARNLTSGVQNQDESTVKTG